MLTIFFLLFILQYAAVERLERAIEAIQTSIEAQGGSLVVKMKVRLFTSYSNIQL